MHLLLFVVYYLGRTIGYIKYLGITNIVCVPKTILQVSRIFQLLAFTKHPFELNYLLSVSILFILIFLCADGKHRGRPFLFLSFTQDYI